ncbi:MULTISPECIES: exodeoxyribonuclease V subunit gamma [unclassified Psychrobacter]|uniref:exodeoxyribonuclease V subunit gamma n=1 Tax=unclassified Psychrobacter TaxID=196806 RepID=UPI0018F55BA1|nr:MULTISPECIES: exodeoxyribonuclease V subunit gamma [unclassified Psychrobacter]
MFTIVQSHRTERLVAQLLAAYQSKTQSIFDKFVVIVPSMVLGDWLDKSIASQAGISTLLTTQFWGQYQWSLMQQVLGRYNTWLAASGRESEMMAVPEVPVLTGAVMQWRLFGYFSYYQQQILADDKHPLYALLSGLIGNNTDRSQQDARLWSLATDFARVFSRYLTHRQGWLARWGDDEAVDVAAMIAEKDAFSKKFDPEAGDTPEWLVAHYTSLELAQRHLWRLLFAAVYEHRAAIETRFWSVLEQHWQDDSAGLSLANALPDKLHIFTIQQLPQAELDFLQRLSLYMDITLLHYNPSQLFWADIVDKQWLQRQQVINPNSVFLRDYGHTLLSRLGKQSRETFAMLASLSGNAYQEAFQLEWQDRFEALEGESENDAQALQDAFDEPQTLLAHLQQDILMLDEASTQQTTRGRLSAALGEQMALDLDTAGTNVQDDAWYSDLSNKHYQQARPWRLAHYDNSLSIHSCHNLQRQLEVLRGMIGHWLNDTNPDGSTRHLSDIVVLLPDVERHHDLINSVFVAGVGQDGLHLPAKITGVVDKSIRQLWEAISGFYKLLDGNAARFEAATVLDWLMLPPLYESLGLTHEQMSRGCELLLASGFVRGFDEAHLQASLSPQDYDYRFSFSYTLDKLTLGLIMPDAPMSDCLYPNDWQAGVLPEKTVPAPAISLSDAPIIEALCRVHQGLEKCRYSHEVRHRAEEWLNNIENDIIHPYFGELDQTRAMRAIFNAMNSFKSSLRANRHYQRYHGHAPQQDSNASEVEARLSQVSSLPLKLSFMLDSIESALESQQVSAEPTGVITFGRFGALRNVPFGLVVMLNMDLSEFPNRDRDNRYDLMKAGLAERGDRFSEDDDNGAFLDALLCARSACWIFYNGQRLTDNHEHLPANPVSELLQFLQGEVQWQWQPLAEAKDNNDTALQVKLQRQMPKLIESWLVTEHPALPFDARIFIDDATESGTETPQDDTIVPMLHEAMRKEKRAQQRSVAPAPVWREVFDRLHHSAKGGWQNISLLTPSDYQTLAQALSSAAPMAQTLPHSPAPTDMAHLYRQVRHPMKHFLKAQNIHIVESVAEGATQEHLSLSPLHAYQINQQLLLSEASSAQDVSSIQPLLYDAIMPAGVARYSSLDYQQQRIKRQCQNFYQALLEAGIHIPTQQNSLSKLEIQTKAPTWLTPCSEQIIVLNDNNTRIALKGDIPSGSTDDTIHNPPKLWLKVLPNTARAPHLLWLWLMHLYWQVARQTSAAQVAVEDGKSIWCFHKGTEAFTKFKKATNFVLPPIESEEARAELLKWLHFAQMTAQLPIVLMPRDALTYIDKSADEIMGDYQPKSADFKKWLGTDSWGSDSNPAEYDDCAWHPLWQYVLQDTSPFAALKDALLTLAEPLFAPMYRRLTPLS